MSNLKKWWAGDSRVEEFMPPVAQALDKLELTSAERTAVYNRAYEAVYSAIKKSDALIAELDKDHKGAMCAIQEAGNE